MPVQPFANIISFPRSGRGWMQRRLIECGIETSVTHDFEGVNIHQNAVVLYRESPLHAFMSWYDLHLEIGGHEGSQAEFEGRALGEGGWCDYWRRFVACNVAWAKLVISYEDIAKCPKMAVAKAVAHVGGDLSKIDVSEEFFVRKRVCADYPFLTEDARTRILEALQPEFGEMEARGLVRVE